MTTDRLDHTRKLLIADIYKAFEGVTRDGGVSWTESDAIDDYADEIECEIARSRDTDKSWTELVEDPLWSPDSGGDFCFLDPIGFRYYLPAAMMRAINQLKAICLPFHLTIRDAQDIGQRELRLDQWSLLNRDQRHCVVRFLNFMSDADNQSANGEWQRALNSYWSTALDK